MAAPGSQSVSVMVCIAYKMTLLEGLHEEILGIWELHEVARNFLEVLHKCLLYILIYYIYIYDIYI